MASRFLATLLFSVLLFHPVAPVPCHPIASPQLETAQTEIAPPPPRPSSACTHTTWTKVRTWESTLHHFSTYTSKLLGAKTANRAAEALSVSVLTCSDSPPSADLASPPDSEIQELKKRDSNTNNNNNVNNINVPAQEQEQKKDEGLSKEAKIGIGVGVPAAVFAFIALLIPFCRRN